MVWNKVAESYMSTFVRARSERIVNDAYRILGTACRTNAEQVVTPKALPVSSDRPRRVSVA
jgi:hypothetical protein